MLNEKKKKEKKRAHLDAFPISTRPLKILINGGLKDDANDNRSATRTLALVPFHIVKKMA